MTIIVVTHEYDIAAYADRVVTMRDGQIISDERPSRRSSREGRSPDLDLPSATSLPSKVRTNRRGSFRHLLGLRADDRCRGVQALARNKMRSALTMLGVFIGVAALIAMVAVGQGANEAVRKQIESLGTNLLVIVPGAARSGESAPALAAPRL